ncbi:MAG: 50S ribosomal protein L20 [Erysipelothrix sp.]|nr:50S ribosomal protein L20 [Erysipelothrix sp.]
MARVKGNVASRTRRKKRLKLAKGYFGSKHRLYRTANEQVMRSQRYAYIGRKQLKRDMRKMWITRINAGARMNGTTYSKLTHGLRLADVQINRKMLSEMAIHDEKGFSQLVEIANQALENKAKQPKAVEVKAEVKPKTVKKEVEVKEVTETVVEEVEVKEVTETVVEEVVETKTEEYTLESYGSTWSQVVETIIDRHVGEKFSIDDVLAHQDIAAKIYPKNNSVEATIKRNVTTLVKENKLEEVSEDNYKKL